MKIKGHSTIELTNVKTGEIERYEDDNMVTNALNKYMENLGTLSISPMISNGDLKNNPLDLLMGGLLIFDTEITENANTVIRPGGIKMIGNGSYEVTANGDDGVTEMGSWNFTESHWTSDGKRVMVWDFATTQANGTIACICLTSANHGYIGEGNNNVDFASRTNKRSDYAYTGSAQGYSLDSNNNALSRMIRMTRANSTIDFIDYHNFFYDASFANEHMSQTSKLKVITKKIPLSKLDMRMSYPMGNTEGEAFIPKVETEITLPPQFTTQLGNNTPQYACRCGNNYYMLAKSLSGLASGGTVEGVKIDCSTLQVTRFTITNTIGYAFGDVGEFEVMFGNNTVAVVMTYRAESIDHTGVFFQNISNNADTDFVEVNTNIYGGKNHLHEEHCTYGSYKIDFVNRTVLPINGGGGNAAKGIELLNDNPLINDYSWYITNQGWVGQEALYLQHSTDYIATINNLQTPVVKTAEKTMKITYVLRFDQE